MAFSDLPDLGSLAGHTFADVTGSGEAFRQWMATVRTEGIVAQTIGAELGYAERTTSDTTANTALDDTTLNANKIAGLSVSVVGTGRPVRAEVYVPKAYSSSGGADVFAFVLVNGVASVNGQFGVAKQSGTGDGPTINVVRRMVLVNGVSYTFEVAKAVAAGTAHYDVLLGSTPTLPNGPMSLAVIGQ